MEIRLRDQQAQSQLDLQRQQLANQAAIQGRTLDIQEQARRGAESSAERLRELQEREANLGRLHQWSQSVLADPKSSEANILEARRAQDEIRKFGNPFLVNSGRGAGASAPAAPSANPLSRDERINGYVKMGLSRSRATAKVDQEMGVPRLPGGFADPEEYRRYVESNLARRTPMDSPWMASGVDADGRAIIVRTNPDTPGMRTSLVVGKDGRVVSAGTYGSPPESPNTPARAYSPAAGREVSAADLPALRRQWAEMAAREDVPAAMEMLRAEKARQEAGDVGPQIRTYTPAEAELSRRKIRTGSPDATIVATGMDATQPQARPAAPLADADAQRILADVDARIAELTKARNELAEQPAGTGQPAAGAATEPAGTGQPAVSAVPVGFVNPGANETGGVQLSEHAAYQFVTAKAAMPEIKGLPSTIPNADDMNKLSRAYDLVREAMLQASSNSDRRALRKAFAGHMKHLLGNWDPNNLNLPSGLVALARGVAGESEATQASRLSQYHATLKQLRGLLWAE